MEPFYQTKLGRLYKGDCRKVLPKFSLAFDLVLIDPPYPNYEKGWDVPDMRDIEGHMGFCRQFIFWPSNVHFPLSWTSRHIWNKTFTRNFQKFEMIYERFGKKNAFVYSDMPNLFRSQKENEAHPTQKPLSLINKLILSAKPSTVLDCFMGSGTTAHACEKLGINWIGIEQNDQYCDMIVNRIKREISQQKLFHNNKTMELTRKNNPVQLDITTGSSS